jgi:poly(3-hydroxyalkanoate) synthetase
MKTREALRQRDRLARAIGQPIEIVRGSLLERTIWHKKGCQTCARGQGHPALVLSINYPGGRNKQISIPPEQKEQVERWLKNYHNVKTNWKRSAS